MDTSKPAPEPKLASDKVTEDSAQKSTSTPEVGQDASNVSALAAEQQIAVDGKETSPAPKAWSAPKLWTGLFNAAPATSTAASSESGLATTAPGFGKTNSESLAEALRTFNAASSDSKVAFLEPRGLVNTGNMCYMNSVSFN